jgi:uncharacterized iron-regulated membrane protein
MRSRWRWLHRWIGLALGLPVALLGLTGSALVYQEEILERLYPQAMQVAVGGEVAPPSALFAVAHGHAAPLQARVSYLRFPDAADRPVRAVLALPDGGTETLLLDPYSARVIGPLPGRLFPHMFDLHSRLALGVDGRAIVGWLGIVLGLAAGTGLVLWWPRHGRWRQRLRLRRHAGLRLFSDDLHRSGGALAAVPLLLLGLSGSALVFRDALLPAMTALGGIRPERAAVGPAVGADLDAMVAQARALMPGGTLVFVTPASRPGGTTRIRIRLPGEIHQNGRSYVLFDAEGRVVELQRATALPAANVAFDQLPYPLHTGFLLGAAGRLVVFAAGLLPAVLLVTGLYFWIRGRRRAAHRQAA